MNGRVVACPKGHLRSTRGTVWFYCHGTRFRVRSHLLEELPKVQDQKVQDPKPDQFEASPAAAPAATSSQDATTPRKFSMEE